MEQLTKEELTILANLLANAQVPVKDAAEAMRLLAKLQKMIEQKLPKTSEK